MFEGVCETHVILIPGACGTGGLNCSSWTVSAEPAGPAGLAGSAGPPGKFQEACFCAQARYLRAIGLRGGVPKRAKDPKVAQGIPRAPQGTPGDLTGAPKAPKREPKGVQGHPKGAKRWPKRAKETPRDDQREPKGIPKRAKDPKVGPKDAKGLYRQTPDQPPKRPLWFTSN